MIYDDVFRVEDVYLKTVANPCPIALCDGTKPTCTHGQFQSARVEYGGWVPKAPQPWLLGTHNPADEVSHPRYVGSNLFAAFQHSAWKSELNLVCKVIHKKRLERERVRWCFATGYDLYNFRPWGPLPPANTLPFMAMTHVGLNFDYLGYMNAFDVPGLPCT
jgi:hypothetical protein